MASKLASVMGHDLFALMRELYAREQSVQMEEFDQIAEYSMCRGKIPYLMDLAKRRQIARETRTICMGLLEGQMLTGGILPREGEWFKEILGRFGVDSP